ncbi:jg4646 [Pararge aegeria aegeria]|uniref:Jg4646 protein n=1 Tax=Pararge aegeria aegeria TaxID=348720 RepID=A0A8S4RKV3_9NEOP|nr:jg4646 [Pararge aegeria aegeria]
MRNYCCHFDFLVSAGTSYKWRFRRGYLGICLFSLGACPAIATSASRLLVVLRCCNGDPASVNAALVAPQRGRQTLNELLGAAGKKWPRTVDFGTPNKRTMSSSGRQSVEEMMICFLCSALLGGSG